MNFAKLDRIINSRTNIHHNDNVVVAVIKTNLKNTFVGIARCSDRDEFDFDKGKRIATLRALRKQNKAMIRMHDKKKHLLEQTYLTEMDRLERDLSVMYEREAEFAEALDNLTL